MTSSYSDIGEIVFRVSSDSGIVVTDESISERAEKLWREAGCPEGKDEVFWTRAQAELEAETLDTIRRLADRNGLVLKQQVTPGQRPRLFVGSSSEGLELAETVQLLLDDDCEVTIWNQGLFEPSEYPLRALFNSCNDFDFALLVLTPDDFVHSRGGLSWSPRDNVVFELGFFFDRLGQHRTFMLHENGPIKIPTDLASLNRLTFRRHASGNLTAALGAPCRELRNQIRMLGPKTRPRKEGTEH